MNQIEKLKISGLFLILLNCHPAPTPAPRFLAHIYYKDSAGSDLLNPSTPGHYDKNVISVSDIIMNNAVKIQVAGPFDSCNNYVCQPKSNGFYFVNFIPNRQYLGSLIHLSSAAVDTLTYETIPMNSGVGINKVLYKGQVIWSYSPKSPTDMVFTIIK